MSDTRMSIYQKYKNEIEKINYKLDELEKERVYEKTKAKVDGSLVTNIVQLRKMIEDLLEKIENEDEGENELLARAFSRYGDSF